MPNKPPKDLDPKPRKPKQTKRLRQWEAMQPEPSSNLLFPEPDPPRWKPMG